MVTIYALINPFTNLPFYVGRTDQLDSRVLNHSSDFMRRTSKRLKSYTVERDNVIKQIREQNLKLEAIKLIVCPVNCASKCEQYICNLLRNNGYALLQRNNCG